MRQIIKVIQKARWQMKVQVASFRHVCVCCSSKDYRTQGTSVWCSRCKYYGPEGCPKGDRCLR